MTTTTTSKINLWAILTYVIAFVIAFLVIEEIKKYRNKKLFAGVSGKADIGVETMPKVIGDTDFQNSPVGSGVAGSGSGRILIY